MITQVISWFCFPPLLLNLRSLFYWQLFPVGFYCSLLLWVPRTGLWIMLQSGVYAFKVLLFVSVDMLQTVDNRASRHVYKSFTTTRRCIWSGSCYPSFFIFGEQAGSLCYSSFTSSLCLRPIKIMLSWLVCGVKSSSYDKIIIRLRFQNVLEWPDSQAAMLSHPYNSRGEMSSKCWLQNDGYEIKSSRKLYTFCSLQERCCFCEQRQLLFA